MDTTTKSPRNFHLPPHAGEELMTWAKTNKTDMVPYLAQLLEEIPRMGQGRGDAFLLLIATSFTAGRWFQKAHPDVVLFGDNPYAASDGVSDESGR